MGGYYNPLTLFDEDSNSRFLDLYNRFQPQMQDFGTYLEPDDPDLKRYQELASSPTGSEGLIADYVSSRPTREQFDPSFGRKMVAFLVGTLGKSGYRGAREVIDRPYNEAEEEWTNKGKNIASRARLMDTERNRQLQALKFGLGTKERTLRAQAVDESKKEMEARRVASEIAREEERKHNQEALEKEREKDDNLAREIFDNRKQMQEFMKQNTILDNTRADEANKRAAEAAAYRAADLDRINKDLSAFASQQGIDTTDKTALAVAKELAYKKAKAHPAFGDLLIPDNTVEGGFITNIPKNQTPQTIVRQEILKRYLETLTKKYLRGEFK